MLHLILILDKKNLLHMIHLKPPTHKTAGPYVALLFLMLLLSVLSSCEQAVIDDGQAAGKGEVSLRLRVAPYRVSPLAATAKASTAERPITEVCTRIDIALFQDGKREKSLHQQAGDADFGDVTLSIARGTYDLVIIGHNGDKGATITSPEKVTFDGNRVTDTFSYYDRVTIDTDADLSVTLERVVAMFRLSVEDITPDEVAQMQFAYTGGSSTLDATTGKGCVNSRQKATLDVPASAHSGGAVYEVYTIPRADSEALRMTVSALGTDGTVLYEATYEDVPVQTSHVTECAVHFFDADAAVRPHFGLTVHDGWATDRYTP